MSASKMCSEIIHAFKRLLKPIEIQGFSVMQQCKEVIY